MRYLLDLLQGAGLAGAAGIRPFLPALTAGAFASGDLFVDFDDTSFAFLESPGFLLALVLAVVLAVLAQRRGGIEGRLEAAFAGIAIGLGALLGAASLDDRHDVWWPGLLVGAASAALANSAVRSLLARTRARLDAAARAALPAYADGAALVLAALTLLAPPVALVALGFFAWLLIGARRRAGQKYAGLRILR